MEYAVVWILMIDTENSNIKKQTHHPVTMNQRYLAINSQ